MDIKDSYLHGTVGVVKSIDIDADKLIYKLADVASTTRTITLPLATTSANGLMSKEDKLAINSLGNASQLNKNALAFYTKTDSYIAFNLYDQSLLPLGSGEKGHIEYYDNNAWYNSRWGWVEAVNGFKGNLTGNATSADKLKTKVKLWGNDFDGTTDINGTISNVPQISALIPSDGIYPRWRMVSLGQDSLRIQVASVDGTTKDGNLTFEGFESAYLNSFKVNTKVASFTNSVTATSFIGNLDGTYVNKLTGYTKATAIAALATTDTLNAALGKLEFKTDFIYNDLLGIDNDDIINKWHEIVDFIDSVKEGTDILDEFVTRKTDQTITGQKIFNTESNNTPLKISRIGDNRECLNIGVDNQTAIFNLQQDEIVARYRFIGTWTNTGNGGDGTKAGTAQVEFSLNANNTNIYLNDGTANYTVLHSGNYNSYSPKLDGTGAIGTWGINISGSAALLEGKNADYFLRRGRMTNPSDGTDWHGAIPFILALKAAGKPLFDDVEFSSGTNKVKEYNNMQNGAVTVERIVDDQGSANSSGYILKISSTAGSISPGRGGFYQETKSRQNAVFAQIFRAKIPVGYSVYNAENTMGSGWKTYWLTDRSGTGKWEWYVRITQCGNGVEYSTGGHVYLNGSGAVTWYLAYCSTIDLTNGNYDGLRTKYADVSDSAVKLTTTSKTAWGQTYWTSGGVPTSISGDMTGVGDITMSGSINSVLKATTSQKAALLNVSEITANINYIHLYVSSLNDSATNTRALVLQNGYGNVGIGTTSPEYKLDVNGDTCIRGALFLGASLNIYNTDQINGTQSGIALNYNCEKIVNTSIYNGRGSHIATFYGNSNQTRLFGNLLIGNDPNKNYIAFYGTTGDNVGGFNNTYIGENLWGTPESSELVLFKGSDFGSSATTATNSGPDRIRHIAGAHLFQVFPSALNGTFEAVCASTAPMNILAINSGNIVAFKELLPASDVVLNLGSTGYRWNEVYAKNFTASGAFIGNLTGYAGYIGVFDTRNDTITPETYSSGFRAHFQATGTNDMSDGGSYYGLIHFRPWPHTSGGYPYQLAFTENHNLWFRKAISSTAWGRWQKIITSYNYNLFAPKLDGTGANGTWNININGSASKAAQLSGGSVATWGTLTAANGYTNICTWDAGNSGAFSLAGKGGQMSLQLNGFFYQNEGKYMVLDTNNAKESVGEFGYVMRKYTIDASALDENTWYPVTIPVSSYTTRIECIVYLNSGTKPSWSNHSSGFSVRKIWEVNGFGWGTAAINRLVYVSDCYCVSTDPVRGIGQLGNNSIEYVYVRGGGKYFFYTSHNKVPTLRTSTYTVKNQSVSPTTTTPATIRPNVDVYQQGYSTSPSISILPVDKQSVICTISASGTLGLYDIIPEGRELHVIIKNTSSSAITITIPSTMINVMGGNLQIDGNSYGELNILSCGSYYVRGVS